MRAAGCGHIKGDASRSRTFWVVSALPARLWDQRRGSMGDLGVVKLLPIVGEADRQGLLAWPSEDELLVVVIGV